MNIQLILTNVERRDNCLKRLSKFSGGKLVTEWDGESIPVIVGNKIGCDKIQIECRKRQIPYIYIDNGYFNRSPTMEWARFCVSNYHCNDWRDSDRIPNIKPIKKWRTEGGHVVVIMPADKVNDIYPVKVWYEETMETLKLHTDRKIIIKKKGEGALNDVLSNAWAAVCYGSVADVDAARLGIPVFSSEYSPVNPIALRDLSQIETPITPDREKWLRSLAAAEWHADEMKLAWERICPLLLLQNSKQP